LKEECEQVSDLAFFSYFAGLMWYVSMEYAIKEPEDSLEPFVEKLSKELIFDVDEGKLWTHLCKFSNIIGIRIWVKKYFLMMNIQRKLSEDEIPEPEQLHSLSDEEIMSFFISFIEWIPHNIKNVMQVKEEYLRCVRNDLCPNYEWEKVLDLWSFFNWEDVVQDWTDILIDKFGIRKYTHVNRNANKPDDLSDEGIEFRNFQESMR